MMRFRPWRRLRALTPQTKRWITILGLGALIVLVLAWRISALPSGVSESEQAILDKAAHSSLAAPEFLVDLPYNLVLRSTLLFSHSSILASRVMNLALAAGGLVAFYHLARQWWSRLVAGCTTVLLGTSQWFLLTGRLIGPQALSLLCACTLLLLFVRLKHQARWWQACLNGFVAGLTLYISPLLGWLAVVLTVLAAIYSIRTRQDRWGRGGLLYLSCFGLALLPLILSTVSHGVQVASDVLGLSTVLTPVAMKEQLPALLRGLVWDGRQVPLLLPGIGLIDWITLSFCLLGIFRSVATWRLDRSQALLITALVAGIALVISDRWYNGLAILLPPIYLFVARGINQYLYVWRQRFPRNRSAHAVSLLAVFSLALAISFYNLRVYYVAWARSEVVQSQFTPYNKDVTDKE